jgi:hypothetical protein
MALGPDRQQLLCSQTQQPFTATEPVKRRTKKIPRFFRLWNLHHPLLSDNSAKIVRTLSYRLLFRVFPLSMCQVETWEWSGAWNELQRRKKASFSYIFLFSCCTVLYGNATPLYEIQPSDSRNIQIKKDARKYCVLTSNSFQVKRKKVRETNPSSLVIFIIYLSRILCLCVCDSQLRNALLFF